MKKNLVQVMIANIFYMLVVAGTNFILPRFTTVETYAAIKEYTLYITTYADIVTLGYLQGSYIRFGGKNIKEISPKEIGANFYTFFFFMLPIAALLSLYGFFTKNSVIIVMGAGLLATEIVMYFQLLYQATGEFKAYGVALNASKILVFFAYLFLIFGFPKEIKILFVGAAPTACVVVAVYLSVRLDKHIHFLREIRISLNEYRRSIKDGFVIMLGNFVTSFFTTIDRWFVKTLMATVNFAFYSFAVSLENIVNSFMRPITVSMYNYFCKKPSSDEIASIKDVTIVYSFIVIAAAYPAKWIMEHFIPNYLPTVTIVFPLFAAQGISTIIKGIYVNKYKADGEQNKYLYQMIGILLLAIVLNGFFYSIFHSMTAIAIATLVTNMAWFFYSELKTPEIRCGIRTYIAMLIMLITYLYSGIVLTSVVGMLVYSAVGVVSSFVLMNSTTKYILKMVLLTVKKKLVRDQ